MSFTGKATYSAGLSMPEIAEDVSDLIALNSPYETPLLDALGDSPRPARATVHEWVEDALLPNSDTILVVTDTDHVSVGNPGRFRVGDQLRVDGTSEMILVTAVNTGTGALTLQRGYGASPSTTLAVGNILLILGNAALEGADADAARFSNRSRQSNFTQIFSVTVEVSGSELAVQHAGTNDELDYQKVLRSRELLRDLENSVINGVANADTPTGTATIRRTMRGIVNSLTTNIFQPGVGGFPSDTSITETQLNTALRSIWQQSNAQIDLILVGGKQKRAINSFIGTNRRFASQSQTFTNLVNVYESDFGVCRTIVSRFVPAGTLLLLDSSRLAVLPLAGRSFHFKPLAITGDSQGGQLIGEYTLELRNENAHGIITGLA